MLPKWQKKLTAKERRHLKEMGVSSLDSFKHTREVQLRIEQKHGVCACFECRHIARQLEIK